jgi:hypothetical protein
LTNVTIVNVTLSAGLLVILLVIGFKEGWKRALKIEAISDFAAGVYSFIARKSGLLRVFLKLEQGEWIV